jgi:uncharacterized protein (DUF58 family)
MIRKILGFALLAVLVLLAVKIAFAVLGTLLGVAMVLLVFAAMGYVMYAILRVFSPATAARVRTLMSGRPNKLA